MNKFFLALVLLPLSAQASPGTRISCLGRAHGVATYLEANLASVARLDHVAVRIFDGRADQEQRDRMDGLRDASRISPLQGTRFYFHSGNTSTFLRLPDSQLAAVGALLAATDRDLRDSVHDRRYSFTLDYVTEGYEDGGYRDITRLRCGPKTAGDAD